MIGELTDRGMSDDGKMIARIDDVPFTCIPKTYPFLEKLERGYQVEYELEEQKRIKKIWRAKKAAAQKAGDGFTTADKMKAAGFNVPNQSSSSPKETMSESEVAALKARADEAQREKAHAEEMARVNKIAKEHKAMKEQLARDEEMLKAAQAEAVPAPEGGIAGIVAATKANAERLHPVPAHEVSVTLVPPGFAVPKTYSSDEMILLRNVIAKDCTEPEFKMMMYMAGQYGLDPLLKQIWAVKRNERTPAVIFVGRDGMLAIAHRSGQFDGIKSGVIYREDDAGKEHPVSAWCEIWRKDMSHSFKSEVRFDEYEQPIPASGYKGLWQTKPSVMIIKVAESVCLRKAFVVSGVYDPDEFPAGGA